MTYRPFPDLEETPTPEHRHGTVERLAAGGTILGMLPELPYRESRTRLQPGDLLALFSDGIVEATNAASEEFGDERLATMLLATRDRGAAATIEATLGAVTDWSSGHAVEDDITMVVLARVAV